MKVVCYFSSILKFNRGSFLDIFWNVIFFPPDVLCLFLPSRIMEMLNFSFQTGDPLLQTWEVQMHVSYYVISIDPANRSQFFLDSFSAGTLDNIIFDFVCTFKPIIS